MPGEGFRELFTVLFDGFDAGCVKLATLLHPVFCHPLAMDLILLCRELLFDDGDSRDELPLRFLFGLTMDDFINRPFQNYIRYIYIYIP